MMVIARTTNAVEGWHFGIQSYFSGAHPNMWKVVGKVYVPTVQKKLTKRSGHKFKFENDSKNNDFKFFGIG